jgi:hypothetical protein
LLFIELINKGVEMIKTKMKLNAGLLFTGILLGGAAAADPRIVVEVDGSRYSCGSGDPGGSDPGCTEKLSRYCTENTSHSSNICFDTVRAKCRGTDLNYPSCVVQTARYCADNTSHSNNICFDDALDSCHGDFIKSLELMEDVKHFTEMKARGMVPNTIGGDQ